MRLRIPELNEQRRKETGQGRAQICRGGARRRPPCPPRRPRPAQEDREGQATSARTTSSARPTRCRRLTDQTIAEIDGLAVEGKGNHAGLSAAGIEHRALMAPSASRALKRRPRQARRRRAGAMSPSSWTATAAGRRRAACRGSKATAAASRPCAAPCARAIDLGIGYLTVYSFSSENWRGPPQEVSDLMGLLKRFIRNDLADLHAATSGCASSARVTACPTRSRCASGRGREPDPRQHRPDARGRLQLRRPPGDRRRPPARSRRDVAAGAISPPTTSRPRRSAARLDTARHPRPRPRHPHLRRAAALQLPALAGGLCRVRLHAGALARFRPRGARGAIADSARATAASAACRHGPEPAS